MSRDSFDPNCYTVEQQREGFSAACVTEMIRAALKEPFRGMLGYMIDENGALLFPVLAAKPLPPRPDDSGGE